MINYVFEVIIIYSYITFPIVYVYIQFTVLNVLVKNNATTYLFSYTQH